MLPESPVPIEARRSLFAETFTKLLAPLPDEEQPAPLAPPESLEPNDEEAGEDVAA